MAKNLKLNIKNTQIAEAISLGSLKSKLAAKKKASEESKEETADKKGTAKGAETKAAETVEEQKEDVPRIRARSKSAFTGEEAAKAAGEEIPTAEIEQTEVEEDQESAESKITAASKKKSGKDEIAEEEISSEEPEKPSPAVEIVEEIKPEAVKPPEVAPTPIIAPKAEVLEPKKAVVQPPLAPVVQQKAHDAPREKLGPTGRHMRDFLPKPKPKIEKPPEPKPAERLSPAETAARDKEGAHHREKPKVFGEVEKAATVVEDDDKKGKGGVKAKEFRDIKPTRRVEPTRTFDARDRQGLRTSQSEEESYRRRKRKQVRPQYEDVTIRPTELKVRIPITIKDLASEMKLKASELVAKLFLQGLVVTLNDFLDDETSIQLLGQEFGCAISIDTTEERRLRITEKTIKEEIQEIDPSKLEIRPPVVAFMGHVDHGKTSLIDAIRKSNRAAGEAGAITQHIGAFRCHTAVGDIAILDTPGHEAFSSMRARGADVTDIVVLVVAGDEGLRQQTLEAIQHARAAMVTIVVAINKSDKPNYNPDNVYRQLAELNLLPEVWGGQTITVNCSAVTGQGVKELLEMLALQAEVLELKASPESRARGTVLESEMHKGLGTVATVLVQNGTLKRGDALVFATHWGRVKTMHDEFNTELLTAGPSTPVEITGISGLPEAGEEFIVVSSERGAKEIAEARTQGIRQSNLMLTKRQTMESLFQRASDTNKKILNVVLRADVQGSLEALKAVLMKIESQKANLNIIFAGVGEVSESDVQLAAASKAVIIGFHTQIESHADMLVKQLGIQVRLHDIIYHAIDDVKMLMAGLLDKIAQENEKGKAAVKATFKASHVGLIAGCIVTEGSINRNYHIRVVRDGQVIWKGAISGLKRVKEDVREVQKGLECGILLNNYNDIKENDVIEAYDITYMTQEL